MIAQYESRLSRDFARTLTQLRQAQTLRVKSEAKELSIQTHQSVAADPCHPSDGVVAPPEIPVEQTHRPHEEPNSRSLASDGQVASPLDEIPAKQTQHQLNPLML